MNDIPENRNWICCQLGAREHYAFARAVHSARSLRGLITDAWIEPNHPINWSQQLRDRFHPNLKDAPVYAWNLETMTFELAARIQRLHKWPLIIKRNHWFQERAVEVLHRLVDKVSHVSKGATTLFAYSYAAREVLRFGKQRGWLTLLGQIDPGPVMEQRARELSQSQNTSNKFDAVPAKYWDDWREECALADRIVVNSQWSCDALVAEKIPLEKIVIIPLAYTSTREANNFEREYPDCFTRKRPLRVLFLGQVTLLKGIIPLLEAACLLADEPIEFWIVGTCQVNLPEKLVKLPQVKWIGSVPRSNTAFYYRQADVFIFPSFSDGFGLTQLEAQSWKLPLIASRFCGDVATHGVNGLLLDTITGEEIAEVLLGLIKNPSRLSEMAKHSYVDNKFSLSTLTSVIHSL